MHTGKRTRSIRLNDLKTQYWEELRNRSFRQMEEALQAHTVSPHELEGVVWDYYRRTTPSLQEFYSRYTPEWEAFYESETLLPSDFLIFLQRMASAFAKRYSLLELNVSYYIDRLQQLPAGSEERRWTQEFFLDRWHRLLTRKEYDYQYHHIASLCEGFVLLDKANGLKTASQLVGSRLRWLLLNRPDVYRQIVKYEKEMERNRAIRELVQVLGRNGRGEKKVFDSLAGMTAEQLVHHGVQSDIEGITQGDDLNQLLPQEYGYLADDRLRPLFIRRFLGKQLQVFDSRPLENPSSPKPGKRASGGQGPFIVCLDTSGSMTQRREYLAKSALLAVARLTDTTHRKCYVINFAEDIQCMAIQNLKQDLPMLADFLHTRFDGGTDIRPALYEALRLLDTQGWRQADVLWISDFEMPPPSMDLQVAIAAQKRKGTSFYALVFGSRPETDYLNCCHRYWDMSPYCL